MYITMEGPTMSLVRQLIEKPPISLDFTNSLKQDNLQSCLTYPCEKCQY